MDSTKEEWLIDETNETDFYDTPRKNSFLATEEESFIDTYCNKCVADGNDDDELVLLENVLPKLERQETPPISEKPSFALLPKFYFSDVHMNTDKGKIDFISRRRSRSVELSDKSTETCNTYKLLPLKKKDVQSKTVETQTDISKVGKFFYVKHQRVAAEELLPGTTKTWLSPRNDVSESLFWDHDDDSKANVHHKSIVRLPETPSSVLINKRGPFEGRYGLLIPPNRIPYKLLLVFTKTDAVSESLSRAADRLNFETTLCSHYDTAMEEFQSNSHDLVIIDTRTPKTFDFDTLCRSIRNTKGSQHSAVVAVVSKSAFENDDVTILSLLDSGFNRCLIESTDVMTCVNELIQLKHSDVRPMAQYATSQALYAALDRSKDIVLITDDSYRLQYANSASERNLGFRQEETLGKTLQEQLATEPLQINTLGASLLRGVTWTGPLSLRRKNQDPITSTCKAIPVCCAGRLPTHFVLVIDAFPSNLHQNNAQSRGSVQSLRRPSADTRSVGSDHLRRTSIAKLSTLPLEAPITKIITLLGQIQENLSNNPQLIQMIDKVKELLKSTELYSVQVKQDQRFRSDEPVATDLIGALLSQQPQPNQSSSSRRSSNDSSLCRGRPGSKIKVPAQIRDLLMSSLSWDFDIFHLEDLSNRRPLQYLGMNLFLHFDVANTLNCDEKVLYNWLTVIEMNYHSDNEYHNSTHAADVMQATAGFLEKERLKSIMEPLDEATGLIASAAHDVDHPGKSSAFLSNSDNPLAILYNDVSVLESHHAALTFKLSLNDDRVNIFKNLERDVYKTARHNVIDMILATEMTKHFEHLAKFVNVFCGKTSISHETDNETDDFPLALPENKTLIKRMMIKCSDVSNPTRPLRLCVEWARRIAEEYFQQTDEEKNRGLPVVMPMFDRQTCSIPKSQIGFVDYIINDMFEAWNAFIDMPELIIHMRQNYIRWKEFDEQGHTTLADIRKLQNTLIMSPTRPTAFNFKKNKS